MHLDTVAVHSGRHPDPTTGAVAPPIHLSTTFLRAEDGGWPSGFKYSREQAPNRQSLEQALAALDGGAEAAAFSSGSAATSAVFQALSPGDHVLCPAAAYHGTHKLLGEVFARWGLDWSTADSTNLDEVRAAVTPRTALIWSESPSNPTLAVTDLAAMADIARQAGARLVVDNTWATPIGQQPIALGADLVMYSTTKYHGGHSDVLGGALVAAAADEFWERIRLIQSSMGAVAAPFDAWLVHRGLASMPCRVRQHAASAGAVADFLQSYDGVEAVHYPGLASHPQHGIARRQMRSFGGMVSVQVRGGAPEAMAVANRLRLFTRATSLGGVESLVEHRKSVEGPDSRTPDNLLRLSIGLEDPADLIDDLSDALVPR
jgi:cystathionine gamma-synthase